MFVRTAIKEELQSQSFGGQVLEHFWNPQKEALLHLGLLRSVKFNEDKMKQRRGPKVDKGSGL